MPQIPDGTKIKFIRYVQAKGISPAVTADTRGEVWGALESFSCPDTFTYTIKLKNGGALVYAVKQEWIEVDDTA